MDFLQLSVGGEPLILHGQGKPSVLRGCLRRPTEALNAERCREQLDLILEGNKTATQQFITGLQTMLTKMEAGQAALLSIRPQAGAPLYESRLLSGEFTWLVGSVQPRGLGLRLELERQNFWELPWMLLPLSNGYGKDTTLPLLIDNRADHLGENNVFCSADVMPGDLPAPLRLYVWNDQGDGVAVQYFYAGLAEGEKPPLMFEGENAQADPDLGVVIDPSSQGGAYALKQGTGQDAMCLMSWQLGAAEWRNFAGKTLFPVARLKLTAPPDLWVWWQVYQGALVQTSLEERLPENRFLNRLPSFHFPIVPEGMNISGDIRLELWGQLAAGETFSFALDAVQLIGESTWLAAVPLPEGNLFPGEILVMDSLSEVFFCQNINNQALRCSHQKIGPGLWLFPHQAACFSFVFDEAGGCFPGKQVRVQLQVRPRVRVMP